MNGLGREGVGGAECKRDQGTGVGALNLGLSCLPGGGLRLLAAAGEGGEARAERDEGSGFGDSFEVGGVGRATDELVAEVVHGADERAPSASDAHAEAEYGRVGAEVARGCANGKASDPVVQGAVEATEFASETESEVPDVGGCGDGAWGPGVCADGATVVDGFVDETAAVTGGGKVAIGINEDAQGGVLDRAVGAGSVSVPFVADIAEVAEGAEGAVGEEVAADGDGVGEELDISLGAWSVRTERRLHECGTVSVSGVGCVDSDDAAVAGVVVVPAS